MEEYVKKLLEEETRDLEKLKEDRLVKEKSKKSETEIQNAKKSILELRKEEEILVEQLDKLHRENFELEVAINSEQATLEKKLNEFREAQSQLNEMYTEIWRKREKFCSDAQEFDSQYGILSAWWKNQVAFVADLEKNGKKREAFRRCQEKIQILGREITEKKRQIGELVSQQADVVVVAHLPESGEPHSQGSPRQTCSVAERQGFPDEKVTFACDEIEDESMTIEEPEMVDRGLFSMMDLNKMKMVKKLKNRRVAEAKQP